ncbi:hypothetical protein MH1LPH_25610 [Lactiplantibacillus brownii]
MGHLANSRHGSRQFMMPNVEQKTTVSGNTVEKGKKLGCLHTLIHYFRGSN